MGSRSEGGDASISLTSSLRHRWPAWSGLGRTRCDDGDTATARVLQLVDRQEDRQSVTGEPGPADGLTRLLLAFLVVFTILWAVTGIATRGRHC